MKASEGNKTWKHRKVGTKAREVTKEIVSSRAKALDIYMLALYGYENVSDGDPDCRNGDTETSSLEVRVPDLK